MCDDEQHNQFNFNEPIGDDAMFESLSETKISPTYVWHEMGHVFGHIIAEKLEGSFGIIEKVNFGRNPFVKFGENEFKLKGQPTPCYDFYGYPNNCYKDRDLEMLKIATLNKRRTLCNILYLVCGGLFNIYCVKKQPTPEDFENCFLDYQEEVEYEGFIACAGSDWSKCRTIAGIQKWKLNPLKEFRNSIFNLLSKKQIFEKLGEFINVIDQKYNDINLDSEQSGELYDLAKNEMEKVGEAFFEELRKLIEVTSTQV